MNEKLQDKVAEYIDALAQKMGIATEYVWVHLVQQKFVEGIVYTGVYVLILVLLISIFTWSYKRIGTYKKAHSFDDNPYAIISTFSGGIFAVWTIVGAIIVSDQVMKIFNPEYYAIKELLDVFR